MNPLKVGLAIALSTVGVGSGVAFGVANLAPINEVQQVEAANYAFDVYVDIQNPVNTYAGNNPGDYASGTLFCHNWDGGTGTTWPGTSMTHVEGTLYGAKIGANNKKCIFNAGNGKSQTNNLDVNIHKVYLLNTGEWVDINHYYSTDDQSASTATTRVFINNSNLTNWNSSNAQTMVRAWGSASYSFDGALYQLNWFENNGTGASGNWYGYADIPTDVSGWQVVRTNPNCFRRIWNYGSEGSITSGGSARVYKIQESGWDFSWNTTTSDSAVGPTFAQKIIEAYDTCSNSGLNGYGAYSQLKSNFFDHLTSEAKTTSCKSLNGIANYMVQQHVDGMASLNGVNAANKMFGITTNNTALLIVVISALSSIGIGSFIFFKKRKHQ